VNSLQERAGNGDSIGSDHVARILFL
jgi:hypothetical protein